MKHLLISLTLLGASLIAAPTEITTMKEYKQLADAKEPVVLFFYAPWCGACKKMKSPFDEITKELNGKARMVKINVDSKELKPLAQSLGITAIPTIVIRKTGVQPKEVLKKTIEAALG